MMEKARYEEKSFLFSNIQYMMTMVLGQYMIRKAKGVKKVRSSFKRRVGSSIVPSFTGIYYLEVLINF